MESRSYAFSTAKKRSTLLESKGISFPKEDINSPRMRISRKECPDEFEVYNSCLAENQSNPDACAPFKEALFECGKPGFVKANTDKDYEY
jgi:hypothetical protein